MKPGPDEGWRIDRRLPVALVGAILLQTAMAVWWASDIDGRVSSLEEQRVAALAERSADRAFHIEQRLRLWDRLNDVQSRGNETNMRLSRLEGSVAGLSANIDRLVDHVIGGAASR
jgi:hypothetical protein